MPEISLADLLTWEPRLQHAARRTGSGADDADLEREVTWAVTIRATPPLLPQVRGGEIVVLPPRLLNDAAAESGISLSSLLHELAGRRITAVVLEEMPSAAPLPVLLARPVTPELESELNRLLTQRRGELYRVGTELGRVLANLTAAQADLAQIATAARDVSGYGVTVRDAAGTVIAGAMAPANRASFAASPPVTRQLTGNAMLTLEDVPPAGRALARLLADRIASAIDAALLRSERERPRGPALAAALHELLTGRLAQPNVAALGFTVGAPLRVVLADPGWGEAPLARKLAPRGHAHAVGEIDRARAFVLEDRSNLSPQPVSEPVSFARAGLATASSSGAPWLAFSGPVTNPADLPAAARQARFVASLAASDALPGRVVHFDALSEIGLYQLLYALWGTPALASFTAAALGDLPAHDRRGLLRATLLAYLEAGGSHVEAAATLAIHRNTLSYRLKQIADLIGHDPDDPIYRLAIHVALLAERLPPVPLPETLP